MEDHPWDQFINTYKIPLILSLVGVVLLVAGIISSGVIPKTFFKNSKVPASSTSLVKNEPEMIKVDVAGAVNSPGVYSLPTDSRIEDALKEARGVTGEADLNFLSKSINMAQKLSDGTKLYIPKTGEKVVSVSSNEAGTSAVLGTKSLININTASQDELDQLSGVGPVTAQKIINSRPYNGIEELLTKKAVTRAVYEKIKDQVSTY